MNAFMQRREVQIVNFPAADFLSKVKRFGHVSIVSALISGGLVGARFMHLHYCGRMDWISDPTAWSALAALLTLEIVLGVDNVVFISILASKLPVEQQDKARKVGLLAAGGTRVLLLLGVGFVITLKKELFAIGSIGFSGKELILLAGGLFLIYKATKEIHHKLEGDEGETSAKVVPTFAAVIGQVLLLDMVFSIDSVITAVGMTSYVWVMVIAIVVAVGIMFVASKALRVGTTAADALSASVRKIADAASKPSGVRNTPTYFDIAFRKAARWYESINAPSTSDSCGSTTSGNDQLSARPTRVPATTPSVKLFDANLFAPCTPVHAASPTTNNPCKLVVPSRVAFTPPHT